MALQFRRGNGANYQNARMAEGEPAVELDNDIFHVKSGGNRDITLKTNVFKAGDKFPNFSSWYLMSGAISADKKSVYAIFPLDKSVDDLTVTWVSDSDGGILPLGVGGKLTSGYVKPESASGWSVSITKFAPNIVSLKATSSTALTGAVASSPITMQLKGNLVFS